jgi:NAD-dependent DNA ligase
MTDDEYDAAMELLASMEPNHPLLTKVRITPKGGVMVKMPYYLGSLDKVKQADELGKWLKKTTETDFLISEKLDGISGLWNPAKSNLYLSGDDNMGLDVSAWLPYISKAASGLKTDTPDVWIRGELIMKRSLVPEGRLGRSIVNGIFHHTTPDSVVEEAKKVRFVAYEVIGLAMNMTMRDQFALLTKMGMWTPWSIHLKSPLVAEELTKLLADRRVESEYDMDGLVIRTNQPLGRVLKGNPKDAVAWKPPNGETKLVKVLEVEWNASSVGNLIPRVKIEAVNLGGSTINYVSGVNARRIVDWKIGPGATVILRKGGDVIPVIDSVVTPATVVFPPADTWTWAGDEKDATNIRQKVADSSTIAAQFMKMVQRLDWTNIGPAQMKAVVDAGYTTVPLLRKVGEDTLKKLVGPVKGAHLYKTIQTDGWLKATEFDLFVASPICPSGIGKTRLEALAASQPDVTKWSAVGLVAPKGWSADALAEFQKVWTAYETFRKSEWSFLPYPRLVQSAATANVTVTPVAYKGSIVFTGFRDAELEATLSGLGYKVTDTVKSDTKAVLISDKDDPMTYTSTKIDKAKKIPGCRILRRMDWKSI